MPFHLSNSIPRMTAHGQRDLFAWSLLAALILLPAGNALLFRQSLHGRRLGFSTSCAGLLCSNWLAARPSTGCRHLRRLLPHRRRTSGHLSSAAPVLYRFLLYVALGWEYLCSYPLMLAGMYFLLRRRLGRQDAAMVGSLAFTFSSFNLLHFVHPNAVAAVAHIPWLLTMIDIVMVDAKRWKVALAQAPGPLDRIADPAGLPAIRLVLALDRDGLHALPGHDAEIFAARRLRNDAHLPRLHRLPAELVVAR